jgi:hypothetical protein
VFSRFSRNDRQFCLTGGRQSNPMRPAILFVAHTADEPSAFKFVGHGDQPAWRHADCLSELPLSRAGIPSQKAQDTDQGQREIDSPHPRSEFRGRMRSQLSQQKCGTVSLTVPGVFFHAIHLAPDS